MLMATFQHLKGVGKKSEHDLWKKGISSWDDYRRQFGEQLTIFENQESEHALTESYTAFNSGDMKFFAERLIPADFYRVALTYPNETLFLDIETTGLSLYYDQITIVGWSIGDKYGVYINGDDDLALRKALSCAKVIVTFNGTMFDLKFLHKTFPNLSIPSIHIDLRYFAKKVSLTGGQKAIEREIGFRREDEDIIGENAPILWHQYRRGDKKALKRLIEYNHDDVEGMKTILDYTITKLFQVENIPSNIRIASSFSQNYSSINWVNRKPKIHSPYKVFIKKFEGQSKPLITYCDLNHVINLEEICIIGIDLVSSEERETGYCILKGNNAVTCRIKTDDEMIRLAKEQGVNLVSIDSPLSIPKGRKSFFDDDPYRDEFGITRLCERILKKRGINSYPCLIPSMQKLTQRGMSLAKKFRSEGIAVIESYPGAAQDIMCIPRKQSGLKHLTEGMAEFGIEGAFTKEPVSHDELDAITSAIVGQFYWAGMFEALGDEEEDFLIIPDLNADNSLWLSRKIIGLSGEIASGKTTVANYLESLGHRNTRYSMVIQDLLEKEGREIDRESLQECGRKVNKERGQRWLGARVVEKIFHEKFGVIDGLRFLEDKAFLTEKFGPAFRHIHIEASKSIRATRMQNKVKENLTLEQSKQSATEKEIKSLQKISVLVIENNKSKKHLYSKVDKILENM